MFLKTVVLNGFKSFADRTQFDFGSGITAVVGPNGCGKSNILDAVRWVLGEQSARSLRGDKMADVIFNGSRTRKPAHFAEVALTFDNSTGLLKCDERDVTVGRVLFRSGESEYRLNGNVCRLKDIRDLLLDTGVGVDAYSIIEQGRVDLMLQANPVERREIFEEAAGISRYKLRRAEAQRKLERAQQNLLRLGDVLDELERRLRSVRLAAGKARNFQQYDARLRELRASFCLAEYHALRRHHAELAHKAARLEELLQDGRARLAHADAEAAEQAHRLQQLDDEIRSAEEQLALQQSRLSAVIERIAQGQRRLEELTVLRDRRSAQAEQIAARMQEERARLAQEESLLAELAQAEQSGDARSADLALSRDAARQEFDAARAALESQKSAAFEAVRQVSILHNQHAHLEEQRSRLSAHAQRLADRRRVLEEEQRGLAEQSAAIAERIAALDRRADDLTEQSRRMEAQQAALAQETARFEQEIGAAKEQRSGVLSRLGVLEDLELRLEGVDAGTRAVLAWRGQAAGDNVLGLAADLLRIDDPRVGLLEAVLATFETHLVVRDSYSFFAELQRRGEPQGALRVIGLDRLASPGNRQSYADAPGVVARAADWAACPDELRPLVEHLLGRVILVDSLERALALAAGAPEGYVFVTADGRTIGADGRMSVGTLRGQSGLISRKAEIRQLRAQLDEIETRLERTQRQRTAAVAHSEDLRLARTEILRQIALTQKEDAEARAQRMRLAEGAQRVERESGLLQTELSSVERSRDELDGQLAALDRQTSAAETTQHEHQERVARQAELLAAHEARLADLSREFTAALVEKGRAAEKRRAAAEALDELRARVEALVDEQSRAAHEADEAARQIADARQELHESREARAAGEAEAARCQEDVLRRRESRTALRATVEECSAAGRQLQHEQQQVESVLHETQVSLREAAVRQENLIARVRDELSVELAEVYAAYEHVEQDWDAVRAEIDDLRQKIQRLGAVNLDAIAELDELTPRHDNLTSQKRDLEESIERLGALIAELDNESRSRFLVAFEQIRTHFQELFRKLFGGGKADVILEDPEQPLECGIEIIARPPGKEPQSISLLSGGEKTMTAVALLMSVFKNRPSPFAVLDEVDAALDEANVDRFNSLLQEFLSLSQFVVITHHKRTMQSADVLYGITMEEPGVSKRVSVRFEDRVQTPNVA